VPPARGALDSLFAAERGLNEPGGAKTISQIVTETDELRRVASTAPSATIVRQAPERLLVPFVVH